MPEAFGQSPRNADSVPERSAGEWAVASLIFGFSVLTLWPFLDYTVLFHDEGIILQGAQRILNGEVLYRDFFSFFTPGSYYWTALRLKLLGSTFFAGRVVLLVYGGAISLALYMLARRACSRWIAALTAYLFLVIGLPHAFYVLHNWDSTVLAVLALHAAVLWAESRRPAWALATGTLVSLTCFFEQSKGAGLLVGLAAGLLILGWTGRRWDLFRRSNLLMLAAGLAWPAAVTFAYFASEHSLTQMVAGWLWPLQHYSASNRLPYGYIMLPTGGWDALYGSGSLPWRLFALLLTSPYFIVPFLPFLGLAVLIQVVYQMKSGNRPDGPQRLSVLVCACSLGLVLGTVATGRPDADHLIYIAPPLILLLGIVLGGKVVNSRLLGEAQPLLLAFLLVTFTAFGMLFLISGPFSAQQSLETRRGHIKLKCCDTVIPYLERHVAPEEVILVYPYKPLYYFLSATRSPTRFDYLQLGMHSEDQVREALEELTAHRPRVVLWWLSFNTQIVLWAWPTTPQQALSRDTIADYILAHYQPCTTLNSQDIRQVYLVRKDTTCPD